MRKQSHTYKENFTIIDNKYVYNKISKLLIKI